MPTDAAGQKAALDYFNKDFSTQQTVIVTLTTGSGSVIQVTRKRMLTNTTPGAPALAGGRIKGYTFTMEKPKIEVIKRAK